MTYCIRPITAYQNSENITETVAVVFHRVSLTTQTAASNSRKWPSVVIRATINTHWQ